MHSCFDCFYVVRLLLHALRRLNFPILILRRAKTSGLDVCDIMSLPLDVRAYTCRRHAGLLQYTLSNRSDCFLLAGRDGGRKCWPSAVGSLEVADHTRHDQLAKQRHRRVRRQSTRGNTVAPARRRRWSAVRYDVIAADRTIGYVALRYLRGIADRKQ